MAAREAIRIRGHFPDSRRAVDVILRGGTVERVTGAGRGGADMGSRDAVIAPALFDIQVNGAGGIDLQGEDLDVEDLHRLADYLAARGVPQWIPTLVTGPLDAMEHGCRTIARALEDRRLARTVPGIHLEGPCISPEDGPRGAHPKAHVRPPRLRDFVRLFRAAEGRVIYTTLAPELPGAVRYIRGVAQRGVAVALGHHQATGAQIARAVDAGARLCTHLGNGAAAQMHRHHNSLWPQLADDRLHASLIADLHHLPPQVLKSFVRMKTAERIVLTSDAVAIAGLAPGRYQFAGAGVDLRANGKVCLAGTGLLAGSGCMLISDVINAWRVTDLSLGQAFASASTVPARLFGLTCRGALPRAGRKANFMLLDAEAAGGPRLQAVFVDGRRADSNGK